MQKTEELLNLTEINTNMAYMIESFHDLNLRS